MTLGNRLKASREARGLNQDQLARMVGVSKATICNLEKGRSKGSSSITKISVALGISAVWLETGTHEMQMASANSVCRDDAKAFISEQSLLSALVKNIKCVTITENISLLLTSLSEELANTHSTFQKDVVALKQGIEALRSDILAQQSNS